jgi:hypothetical protein
VPFLCLALLLAQTETPTERLHVEWVAPDGCPSRASLASSLKDNVPSNRTFHALVRIDEPAAAGRPWHAVVITTADGSQHTRVIDGPDCARLSEAAMLVVTLAATNLPPEKEKEWETRSGPATPSAPQDFSEELTKNETKGPPPSSDPPFSFHLRVQPLVGANVGVFSSPAVSAGAALALMKGPVRAQLSVSGWTAFDPGGRGIRGGLTSVGLKGCWLFDPREAMHVGPCTSLEVGRMSVVGTGVAMPQTNGVVWGAVFAGATAGFSISKSISGWVSAEVGLNAVRPRFFVTTPTGELTVHQVGAMVGRLVLGIEFELTVP